MEKKEVTFLLSSGATITSSIPVPQWLEDGAEPPDRIVIHAPSGQRTVIWSSEIVAVQIAP